MEYIVFFSVLLISLLLTISFYQKMVSYHFYKIVNKAFIKKQQKIDDEKYFSSFGLRKIVHFLLHQRKKEAKKALLYLCVGKTELAKEYLSKKNKNILSARIEAYNSPANAIDLFEEIIKKEPKNYNVLAELGSLYYITGQREKSDLAFEKINTRKASRYARAKKYYYDAYGYINAGDLLAASDCCSIASNYFAREDAYMEEARSLLLMGIIYRMSAISDVAQIMFTSALNIFNKIKAMDGVADTYGNLGMLMVTQERYDEAKTYFAQALECNQKIGRLQSCAHIINQQALFNLLQDNFFLAEEKAIDALTLHQQLGNLNGSAFSLELLSHIMLKRKCYNDALEYARQAECFYEKTNNLSAYLESMYLKASAMLELEKFQDCELVLRKVVAISKQSNSSFHIANAYSMLGLIFLKTGDLTRAKGLFQQSLEQEQLNDRFSGIASDYANIGFVEYRSGQIEQAKETLQLSLEYACTFEDGELAQIIREKISKMNLDLG